jgi:hypothetical protein
MVNIGVGRLQVSGRKFIAEEGYSSGAIVEYTIKKPDGTKFMAQEADLTRR